MQPDSCSAGHPWDYGGYRLGLPKRLWECILAEIDTSRFAPDQLKFDRNFSDELSHYQFAVGDHRQEQVRFLYLGVPQPLTPEQIRSIRMSTPAHMLEEAVRYREKVQSRQIEDCQAYLGWLLTNRDFLQEHDHQCRQLLLPKNESQFIPGFPPISPLLVSPAKSASFDGDPAVDEWTSVVVGFSELCQRWRLSTLAAPFLPAPIAVDTWDFSGTAGGALQDAWGIRPYFVLDTMPLPPAAELRSEIERRLRTNAPDHLREWVRLASTQNTARHVLSQYVRVFQLQHFLRLLLRRHKEAFKRNEARLQQALANFFRVQKDAIRRDMALISRRLHCHWRDIAEI